MRALQPGHELLHGPRCIASLQAYLFSHVSKYFGVLHARCGPRFNSWRVHNPGFFTTYEACGPAETHSGYAPETRQGGQASNMGCRYRRLKMRVVSFLHQHFLACFHTV